MKHIWKKKEEKKEGFAEKLKNINAWWVLAVFFLLANIAAAWYYFYMTMEVKKVTAHLETRKNLFLDKMREHNKVKQDDWFKRYQAAKLVKQSSDMMDWLENTQYLIQLIDKLYEIDQADDTLELWSFEVDSKTIKLEWKVTAIKSIYREWWVIDTFKELSFVENIFIPWYEDVGWIIEFTLYANIQTYDEWSVIE